MKSSEHNIISLDRILGSDKALKLEVERQSRDLSVCIADISRYSPAGISLDPRPRALMMDLTWVAPLW
jgi:hypothetical protein